MEKDFEQGFALILEGETEYQFYKAVLLHLVKKHPECTIEEQNDPDTFEPYYIVFGPFGHRIVRMNAVGTITQIHNSASWFKNKVLLTNRSVPWTVFLCYDTDNYNADITKFHEGDWEVFRKELSLQRVKQIIDLAANADIEDVFLQDLHGISTYLQLEEDILPQDLPKGRKGAVRLKQLLIGLRSQGRTRVYYHKGERASRLIECLDLDKIIQSNILPLNLLEKIFVTESNSTF